MSLDAKNLTSDRLVSKVIQCVNFSALKHKYQKRKGIDEEPYINHPIGVANILCNESNIDDLEIIQAALLHDTVEDTDTTIEEIQETFGPAVAALVAEVTDDKSLSKQARKDAQIVAASKSSRGAKLIKLADKLHNLRDLTRSTPVGWTPERVEEYFEWSYKVIAGLRGTDSVLEMLLDDIFAQRNIGTNEKLNESTESD